MNHFKKKEKSVSWIKLAKNYKEVVKGNGQAGAGLSYQ